MNPPRCACSAAKNSPESSTSPIVGAVHAERALRAEAPSPRGSASLARRAWGLAQWAAPGLILALLPKCPACVAAYVAAATGIGLSFSAAAGIRYGLLAMAIAAFALLIVRSAWNGLRGGAISAVDRGA